MTIIELIRYLIINWLIWPKKSDLDLLPKEERIKHLNHDIFMQNLYEWFILGLVCLIGWWVISKILLNQAEKKKILEEVKQMENAFPTAQTSEISDTSQFARPNDPSTSENPDKPKPTTLSAPNTSESSDKSQIATPSDQNTKKEEIVEEKNRANYEKK